MAVAPSWRRRSAASESEEEHRGASLTAQDTKYGFGRLIDLARAEPIAMHGRPVVSAMSVEKFERLKVLDASTA